MGSRVAPYGPSGLAGAPWGSLRAPYGGFPDLSGKQETGGARRSKTTHRATGTRCPHNKVPTSAKADRGNERPYNGTQSASGTRTRVLAASGLIWRTVALWVHSARCESLRIGGASHVIHWCLWCSFGRDGNRGVRCRRAWRCGLLWCRYSAACKVSGSLIPGRRLRGLVSPLTLLVGW